MVLSVQLVRRHKPLLQDYTALLQQSSRTLVPMLLFGKLMDADHHSIVEADAPKTFCQIQCLLRCLFVGGGYRALFTGVVCGTCAQ